MTALDWLALCGVLIVLSLVLCAIPGEVPGCFALVAFGLGVACALIAGLHAAYPKGLP